MKNIRLLKTLFISTPLLLVPLVANSCNSKAFDAFNLSTWGSTQKTKIIDSYLATARKWYKNFPHSFPPNVLIANWDNWLGSNNSSLYALSKGFILVNTTINLGQGDGYNVIYTYLKQHTGDLATVLKAGVTAEFKGYGGAISGEITITFKGDII